LRKRRKRRYWLCKVFKEREGQGPYNTLLNDLRLKEATFGFNNHLRMPPENLELLLGLLGPFIENKHNPFRDSVPAHKKLTSFSATVQSHLCHEQRMDRQ
jgi:hypothetical protein